MIVGDADSRPASGAASEPDHGRSTLSRIPWLPEAVLASGALALAAANGWWIWTVRRGLPYSIDEAGYLQRAIRDGQHLVHGGAAGLLSAIRTPDIQAPLVPVVASLAYPLVHTDLLKLLISLQVFYVAAVIASYALARTILPRWWSVLTALLIACSPGVLDQSRNFMFAEAATATFAAAVAAQIAAKNGRNRGLLILAGLFSGLTVLSRTMMVAFILVLWAVGVFAVLLEAEGRWQRIRRFFLVPAVGSAVGAIWYSAQWQYVLEYLTKYGYGGHQTAYERAFTLPLLGSLPSRLNYLTSQDLYLVLAVLVFLGLCALLWVAGPSWITRLRQPRGPAVTPSAYLALVAAGALVALCSTANAGSAFELPLIPPLLVLAAAGWHYALARIPTKTGGRFVATIAGAAAALDVATKTLIFLPAFTLTLGAGPIAPVVATSSSVISGYLTGFEGSRATAPSSDGGLWLTASWRVETFLSHYAEVRGYRPIVFFANEGPLFNTNTVQLEYQMHHGTVLPVGVFRDPSRVDLSFVQQLFAPQYGIPNFLVAESGSHAAAFTVVPDAHVARTARAARFREVLNLRLPDGTWATVYWRATGPRIALGGTHA